MAEFFQEGPVLGNQYDEDRLLRGYLRRKLPRRMHADKAVSRTCVAPS